MNTIHVRFLVEEEKRDGEVCSVFDIGDFCQVFN